MSPTPVDIRPLRADAARNRARVLEAARELMGARGVEVGMEEIARQAGVGVGTVYRHFPNKEALISALAEDRFARIAAVLTEALEDPDPWHGFETMMRRTAEIHVADRALSEVMRNHGDAMQAAAEKYGVPELNERLIERCKAAGASPRGGPPRRHPDDHVRRRDRDLFRRRPPRRRGRLEALPRVRARGHARRLTAPPGSGARATRAP